MKVLERVFAWLARAMLHVAAVALLLMVTLVVVASVMRYLVSRPFDFTEELVALLYMAMVFLAIPLVTVRDAHVSVSVMPQRWQEAMRLPSRIGAAAVMIGFCLWFAVEAYGFMAQSRRFNSRSEQVEILLWPWMAIMPATIGFVMVIAVVQLIRGRAIESAQDDGSAPKGDAL